MNSDGAVIVAATNTGETSLPILFLGFGLLLLGLGIASRIAHRFGLSAVPFYLMLGLAFGTGGFYDIDAGGDFVPVVAELGLILLLLLLGLEFSARQLVDTTRTQLPSGIVDLVLNATPGVIMGFVLGWGVVGAVALGGITYSTSSGIVAQVVRDLRWRKNPETSPVVSLSIMQDLLMAPYLPILTVLLTGAGLLVGLIETGVALLVVAVVIFVALRSENRLAKYLTVSEPAGLLLVVFGAAVAAAGFAGIVSFSSAAAAFLIGLLLTGEVADVARRRLDPLREVLAAVFFAYFGLSTDPADLPGAILPALALALITVATKFITGWYAAGRFDGTTISKLRAGALLSCRGEFSVVIAGIVAAAAVLDGRFQAFAAAYILLTATIGPVLARFAEPLGWWWDQRPSRSTNS